MLRVGVRIAEGSLEHSAESGLGSSGRVSEAGRLGFGKACVGSIYGHERSPC